MIIDATKMNYFKDSDRNSNDFHNKKRKNKKAKLDSDVGVIIDASVKGNNRKKVL